MSFNHGLVCEECHEGKVIIKAEICNAVHVVLNLKSSINGKIVAIFRRSITEKSKTM